MRWRATLGAVAAAAIATLGAEPAVAHQSPADCISNSLDLTVSKSKTLVRNGDAIDYTVEVANVANRPCDLTGMTVDIILPAADGTATGRSVRLDSNADYLAGMGTRVLATVPYVVAVNTGVTRVVVEATAEGVLHDAPTDDAARITKSLSTTVTQPHATLTKRATPDHGQAPLTVTYDYLLTNDSSTNAPIAGATVTDDKCAPLLHTGGDTDGDGFIDVGEAWAFTCTQSFGVADTVINTAVAQGRSALDNLPVPIGPAQATVRIDAPPPGLLPPVSVALPPAPPGPPGPPGPPAGAVLGRTFELPPVKSRKAAKDAPCVSVPKRLSVRAGELTVVRVRIRKEPGHVLEGAVVRITGPGFVDSKITNATGEAIFRVRSKRAGTLVIQSNRCLGADRVGVLGARRTNSRRLPRVTG